MQHQHCSAFIVFLTVFQTCCEPVDRVENRGIFAARINPHLFLSLMLHLNGWCEREQWVQNLSFSKTVSKKLIENLQESYESNLAPHAACVLPRSTCCFDLCTHLAKLSFRLHFWGSRTRLQQKDEGSSLPYFHPQVQSSFKKQSKIL